MNLEQEFRLSILEACNGGRFRYRVVVVDGPSEVEQGQRDHPQDALALAAQALALGARQVSIRHIVQ